MEERKEESPSPWNGASSSSGSGIGIGLSSGLVPKAVRRSECGTTSAGYFIYWVTLISFILDMVAHSTHLAHGI